ncbi:MAG TPA: hypothetical protein VKB78_17540, partial [Pirellulales bacterium]|nr:hypothetical protein [Pirellulales bacterium]
GIDPVKIKEVVAIISLPQAGGDGPPFGAVVRFSEPYSKAAVNSKLAGVDETTIGGKPMFVLPEGGRPLVYLADDRTIVIGTRQLIEPMLSAKDTNSAVTKLLKEQRDPGLITAVLSVVDIHELASAAAKMAGPRTPPQLQEFLALPDLLTAVIFRISGGEKMRISLTLRGRDEASAEHVKRILKQFIDMIPQRIATETAAGTAGSGDDAMRQALTSHYSHMAQQMYGQLKPVRDGRDVQISVEFEPNFAMIGAIFAFVFPSVKAPRPRGGP